MATVTRQQLSQQLNTLSAQGASETQISNAIAAAGYKDSDFNIDLSGKFTPLTIGQGKVAGEDFIKPTAAEQAESNNFYTNLAAESSSIKSSSTTTTSTITRTETFSQSTGGGSTTVYSTPSTPTATSQAYKAQADQSFVLAESYRLNPDSKFGKSALDRRLADGRITQDQYNEIVKSSPEQRREKSLEYSNQYEQARTNQINSEVGGTPAVVVQPSQNTSQVGVTYEKTTTTSTTALDGAVGGTNITSTTVNGTEYQVIPNGNGTESYTPVGAPDVNAARATTVTVEPSPVYPTLPPTEVETASVATPTFTQAPQEISGMAAEPFYEVPAPQQPADAYANEFTGVDEAIAEQKNAVPYQDEFTGVDAAIATQQTIDINTSGLPVRAEDGSVAQGVKTNPETGQTYFTEPPVKPAIPAPTAKNESPAQPGLDWRFRISLAKKADYLYGVPPGQAGILNPLQSTSGVIFPYSPTISVTYNANYDSIEPTHSNFKIHTYKNSSVDSITIAGDFTAQDSSEANYLLAVIHFFRSVTKMFYGQDQNPARGVPPPLCYLNGFGQYQFNEHPVVITNFTYNLPTDVDYINAYPTGKGPVGVNLTPYEKPYNNYSTPTQRLFKSGLTKGGAAPAPVFTNNININEVTRVPTKINIQLQCLPIVTRNAISNKFSLREYATGKLLLGNKNAAMGGGIW
jgi:hypothetical protein